METVANENFATPDRPGVVKPPPWLLALVAENRYAAFLITGYTVFRKEFPYGQTKAISVGSSGERL